MVVNFKPWEEPGFEGKWPHGGQSGGMERNWDLGATIKLLEQPIMQPLLSLDVEVHETILFIEKGNWN